MIDGPAGAGKSTTAMEVARQTGFDYVDSGAIYRGFTYLYLLNDRDRSRLQKELNEHGLHFDFHITQARVFYRNREITRDIRTNRVNDYVSEVAAMPEVRDTVRRILRNLSRDRDVVMEGRDLGTVVFPDADCKFFLTADTTERARRRYNERINKGEQVSMDEIRMNVELRDRIDTTRDIAPLKKADDAITIDSTSLTFAEQVARIMDHVRNIHADENQHGKQ